MVLVCLPSDALSQHLPSYLGFSYLGHGVSLHDCSSKAQPLTLDEGYLLTAALPDLERGVARLRLPAPVQQPLLGGGVAPLGHKPSLNKFKQLESMQSLFYINKYNKLYINKLYILHSSITLEISNRKKFGKSTI